MHSAPATSANFTVAMDGHVHLQKGMPWAKIAENFTQLGRSDLSVCLIVESAGLDRFSELAKTCEPWGDLGLNEPSTGLHFVAGRQVVSAEGLEVLHIGSRDQSFEGLPAEQVIATGLDRGAAVCLPWGFGKWLGQRRSLATSLYGRLSRQILLGDITNRPALWREPMFADARVLRGSDNLPMTGSSDTVGLFGSEIELPALPQSAEDLIAALRDPTLSFQPYGKRKSAYASITEQMRLRFARTER